MTIGNSRPKKRLGQHFLRDGRALRAIVAALEAEPGEPVVEIGAGPGALTATLLEAGLFVFAIEIDVDLSEHLQQRFGEHDRLKVFTADARHVDYSTFGERFKVVGNLPYGSATFITTRLMDYLEHIPLMVLTYQKEVARRLTADPGTKSYGFLSCLVQYHCRVDYLLTISPRSFRPSPKVDSGVVRLKPREEGPNLPAQEKKRLFFLIKRSFSQRRKTLINALAASGIEGMDRDALRKVLEDAGIDDRRRPETLSLEEFIRISKMISEKER